MSTTVKSKTQTKDNAEKDLGRVVKVMRAIKFARIPLLVKGGIEEAKAKNLLYHPLKYNLSENEMKMLSKVLRKEIDRNRSLFDELEKILQQYE